MSQEQAQHDLQDLLLLLKKHNVASFEGCGIKVSFYLSTEQVQPTEMPAYSPIKQPSEDDILFYSAGQ
jgi:hypothetical protein